jgi:hypothetical protein
MTKKKSGSAFDAWQLLCISTELEVGDTLLALDEEGKESRYLWLGDQDRYSVHLLGVGGEVRRFYVATLEDKDGRMIVDVDNKHPLSLKDVVLEK